MPANVVSGWYRETPWHRLGKVSEDGKNVGMEFALRESGILNVVASKGRIAQMIEYVGTDGNVHTKYIPIDDWTVVWDKNSVSWDTATGEPDTKGINHLHVCSDDKVIKQFGEVFLPLGEAMAAAGYETPVAAASLLAGGAIAAVTLDFPDLTRTFPDGRPVKPHINSWTSHNQSHSVTYQNGSVCIVCCNTLAAADSDRGARTLRIKHSSTMDAKMKEAVAMVTTLEEDLSKLEDFCTKFLAKKINTPTFFKVLDMVIPRPEPEGDRNDPKNKLAISRAVNRQQEVYNIYCGNYPGTEDQNNIFGTAWGAYNAFSAYVDHFQTYRNTQKMTRSENQFVSNVIKGHTLADRAREVLLAL
jgi:hypothetical protein